MDLERGMAPKCAHSRGPWLAAIVFAAILVAMPAREGADGGFGRALAGAKSRGCEAHSDKYAPYLREVGARYGVCPAAIAAVIDGESCFQPSARAKTSTATGMMQLIERTARTLGLKVESGNDERLDPYKNIDAGTRYLKQTLEMGGGSLRLALAGYYLGPLFMQLYGGVPPDAVKYTDNACRLMSVYEARLGVTCPASYCAGSASATWRSDTPVRLGLDDDRVVEFANGGVVKRLFAAGQLSVYYRFDGGDHAYTLIQTRGGSQEIIRVPLAHLEAKKKTGHFVEIGSSPEARVDDQMYGRVTTYALLTDTALQDAEVTVVRPGKAGRVGVVPTGDGTGGLLLRSAYDGRLTAHPLVERGAEAVLKGWQALSVKGAYLSTLVRTREVHDAFAKVSAGCRKRDLGLLGLSAAIAHTDHGRLGQAGRAELLKDAERSLAGLAEGGRLRVEAHQGFVLVELRVDDAAGQAEVQQRRATLESIGVVKRGGSGLPAPEDVQPAR